MRVGPDSTPDVVTAAGTLLWVAVLLPSWPLVSLPQQYAAPVLATAHVAVPPAVIWVRITPDSVPDVVTVAGTWLSVVELFPSSPSPLCPQQ